MDLKNLISQYKDITINIISSLEKIEYDNVEKLLNKRQEIINELASLSYSSEEFKEVVRDINLLELNKKAVNLISKNRLELRNKMNSIAKGKAARKSYDSNFYESIKKFSKKV